MILFIRDLQERYQKDLEEEILKSNNKELIKKIEESEDIALADIPEFLES